MGGKTAARCIASLRVLAGICISGWLLSACGGGGGGNSPPAAPPPPVTYSIGGSISGLSASGLVLLDNGSDALDVAANASSFTFSTRLTAGSPYQVTVQRSPSSETCTVNNGSGTVSGTVTSIGIQCSTNSYSIGGSISGDTQSGLVLLDNGADALDIPAGASSFTFATPVAAGSSYDVTVQSSPSGETCQVSNAQGAPSEPIDTVAVSCTSIYASASAANVAAITVAAWPMGSANQSPNIPQVSVTVCQPGTTTCATIQNVLVDTGSSGLRLISSALPSGFALTPLTDGSGNEVFECLPFADGYSWGSVAMATVTVGGETTTPAAGIPVQIIDSSPGQIPQDCSSFPGTPQNTVDAFDANGVLGVGVADQDCGSGCTSAGNKIYYGCPAAGCTTSTTSEGLVLTDQVANPVASFPTDNNGVIVQLPEIPASGATSASGYLVFGIGTESASATEADNHLNGASVLSTNAAGQFSTSLGGMQLPFSFIDSGSNVLFFPQPTPALPTCTTDAQLYCPPDTITLSATIQGEDASGNPTGPTNDVAFQIANVDNFDQSNFAADDIGAIANAINAGSSGASTTSYFDWGLPFFYGRTVFTAIEGMPADGATGPYYAY